MPTLELPFFRRALATTLGWFGGALLLGVMLRWATVTGSLPLGLSFRWVTHAHSHLMFLGWVGNALMLGLAAQFTPQALGRRGFQRLFWGLQVAVLGMLFAFPVQGYGPVSIGFLTLHMALTAGWMGTFWRETRSLAGPAIAAARWALAFNALSSLGPFALGFVAAKGLAATMWYPLAIYFYLHFQYNGWFVFGLLALAISWLGALDKHTQRALRWLAWAQFPALLLSALWVKPPGWVWGLAAVGALMQLWAVGRWGYRFRKVIGENEGRNRVVSLLVGMAAAAGLLKILLQAASAIPLLGAFAFANRNVVIAYLHLVFVGLTTFFLLGWWAQQGWLRLGSPAARLGLALGIGGFALLEGLLVWPGSVVPLLLAVVTTLTALGFGLALGAGMRFLFPAYPRVVAPVAG